MEKDVTAQATRVAARSMRSLEPLKASVHGPGIPRTTRWHVVPRLKIGRSSTGSAGE